MLSYEDCAATLRMLARYERENERLTVEIQRLTGLLSTVTRAPKSKDEEQPEHNHAPDGLTPGPCPACPT